MSVTDLVFVESKAGPRVHRSTCKKLPSTAVPLQKVLDFAPGTAAAAKPAGCCKPQIDEALAEVRAAAAEAPAPVTLEQSYFTPTLPDEKIVGAPVSSPDVIKRARERAEAPSRPRGLQVLENAARSEGDPVTPDVHSGSFEDDQHDAMVEYRTYGLARRYWMPLMVGGEQLANAHRDRKRDALIVHGDPTPVITAWREAGAALKEWKRLNESYKLLRKNIPSEARTAYELECDFLTEFFSARGVL